MSVPGGISVHLVARWLERCPAHSRCSGSTRGGEWPTPGMEPLPSPLLGVQDGLLLVVKLEETSTGLLMATGPWGLCDLRPLSHCPILRASAVKFGVRLLAFCTVSTKEVMTS